MQTDEVFNSLINRFVQNYPNNSFSQQLKEMEDGERPFDLFYLGDAIISECKDIDDDNAQPTDADYMWEIYETHKDNLPDSYFDE